MVWRRLLLVTALAAAYCPSTGCIFVWGTKLERVVVDACRLPDGYRYHFKKDNVDALTGRVLSITHTYEEPATHQLKRLDRIILVPFYWHTPLFGTKPMRRPRYEVLGCKVLEGSGDQVSYPPRLDIRAVLLPFPGCADSNAPLPCFLAFAKGCWPIMGDAWGTGGPSYFAAGRTSGYRLPDKADGYIRCIFWPQTKAFDWEVGEAVSAEYDLVPFLRHGLARLCRAVDESGNLTAKDRRLVYEQLLRVVENVRASSAKPEDQATVDAAADLLRRQVAATRATGQMPQGHGA